MPQLSSKIPPEINRRSSAQRAIDPKPRLPSKRKRDSICGLGTFTKPFTIRPCPESPYDKPHTFIPVRIIARSQLPLSFLDTTTDNSLATNQLFSASIDVLENFHNGKSDESQPLNIQVPRILIARHEANKTLYALERVQEHVYSLCKLATWLKEKDAADLWDPENLQAYPIFPKVEPHDSSVEAWWKHAVLDTQPAEKPANRARLSMLRPQLLPEPAGLQTMPAPIEVPAVQETQSRTAPVEMQMDALETCVLPTPQEQMHSFVDQYLDALYISKTSLAYFAKGPIARIRNTFTSPEEGAPTTYELVTFIRTMLLSHKSEEKKYREKMPEVIKDFPPRSFSDDDLADAPKKPKKSKKKVKPNRDGMYPQETEIAKKWWFGGVSTAEMARDESMDQRIKRRLGELRVREALLQMILILEITALESLSTFKTPPEGQGGAAEESQAASQAPEESQPKPKRKKKLDDVNLLLDLLLDKLCIWQSIEQDGVLDFDTTKQDEGFDGSSGQDRLQSFCIEVIVPFYMNRLPEQARMVNKKLGGPAPLSPPKRKAMRPPNVSRKSGEPKESESKKPRRSLGRVATDTTGRTGSVRAPSLNRSATDSTILNIIKREGSEVPISAIPFQRSPSNAARQSASHLKLLKGREMDLNTTSKAAAARAQQRKRVEDDLQQAISALKKPNRGLAAGSYADDVEKRGLGSLGSANRSRKPANPVRKIMKDVQVAATPSARRRTKDMVQQTPTHHDNPFVRSRPPDTYPLSDFCIPSSAARPPPSSVVPATVQRSATARVSAPQGVAETPSKPQGARKLFSIPAPTGRKILTTPSKTRTVHMTLDSPPQAVYATPTKATGPSPPHNSNRLAPTPRTLFATPLKRTTPAHIVDRPLPASSRPSDPKDDTENNLVPTPQALFATPLKTAAPVQIAESPFTTPSRAPETVEEASIYDALGWNDDDDFM
jgi:DNA replication regulator SLD3